MMQCTNPNCAELGTHTNRHQTIEGKPCCVICDLPLGLLADSHEESICKPGQIVRIGPHTTDFLLIENAPAFDDKVYGIHFLGSSTGAKRSICMYPTALDLEKIRQWIHTNSYALRTSSTCEAWYTACDATLEAIHKIKFPAAENKKPADKKHSAADFLNAALSHMQDRAATYDKPQGERSMGKTIAAFNSITGHLLTEEQGWLLMGLLKMVRSQQGNYKADNYEDEAAYAGLRGECAARERGAA